MKILFIGPAYPYRGGLATFNECMARQFVKEGEDVKLETFTLQYPSFLFPGTTQYSTDPAPEDLNISRTVNSINPFNWFSVGRRIAKENYDMVLVRFWLPFMAPCLGTISRLIRKNKKTKVFAIVDNMIPHEKRIGDITLGKYFVNSVDGFITLSQSVLDDVNKFDKHNKPKICTPHPVYNIYGETCKKELACEKLMIDPNFKYVLFFGFIREYKGLDILMESFKYLPNDIRLIVAGEFYNNSERYKRLEKELNLFGRIHWFTEFIPTNEVATYFSAAEIVAQPYKTATQSGVTQVAYQLEKPMLVTNVGGLAEIVPHGKVGYVTEVNPEAVANAIKDFYENDRTAEFLPHIRTEKQKYSWSELNSKTRELFSTPNS
ncbi:MAG: glycosyltransferase [Paludibacteraceae bacterium]|nr:glycosyltransferase [Paludibacteraceae bacterium]